MDTGILGGEKHKKLKKKLLEVYIVYKSIILAMAAFPDDFSLENSENLIRERVLQSTEFQDAKKYVLGEHKKALDNCVQWFIIDLSKYNPTVREPLMTDLLLKFPHIGCPAEADPLLSMFTSLPGLKKEDVEMLNKPLPMAKVIKVDSGVTRYVVALTKEFGESMTRYSFPKCK